MCLPSNANEKQHVIIEEFGAGIAMQPVKPLTMTPASCVREGSYPGCCVSGQHP